MSSSAPAERPARPRVLATPVVGAAAVLLGGAAWKFGLVVTLLLTGTASPSLPWRGLTAFALDAAIAALVLAVGRLLPRIATSTGLVIGLVGVVDLYLAVVIGGPATASLLPYASSLRPGLLDARLTAIVVAVGIIVVVVAAALRTVSSRHMLVTCGVVFAVSVSGIVVDGARGTGPARARLGLDRHHVLILLPSGDATAVAMAAAPIAEVDPETPARRAPIVRQAAAPARHVVLVILESIAAARVDEGTMPRLNALARDHAVSFDDHVAETPVSIKALFGLLCGLPPLPGPLLESTTIPRIDCRSLPEVLVGAGFRAGFFHGGYFAFTDKLAFLTERGFSTLVDGENLPERAGRVWRNGWGVDDRAVVDESLRWLDERGPGERTLNVVVPLIPHHEYFLPDDAPRPFGTRTIVDRYRNGLRFADDVLGRLIDGYEQRGLMDETVFVVVGDHGEAFDEHPGNRLHGSALYEENLRTPLIIRAPALPPGGQRSQRPSTHSDVMPTILGLTGVAVPRRPGGLDTIAGQDLLGDDFVPRPSVHSTAFPVALVAVRGPGLAFINTVGAGTDELYDRALDPAQRRPVDDARARESLRAFGQRVLEQRTDVLTTAPQLGPGWLARAAASSSLRLESTRVFNMVRPCIPLQASATTTTSITISGLDPPARFVGVGVADESRFKKQGGLQVEIVGSDGVAIPVVVNDVFERSSRVVPVPPSTTVTVTAAPSPGRGSGCVWLQP